MAESIAEQIVQALKTSLAAISPDGGAKYWYQPHAVLLVDACTELCLDSTLGPGLGEPAVVYVLSPAEEEKTQLTYTQIRGEMRLDLIAARYAGDDTNPYQQANPNRWTVQNRLARDAERAVRAVNKWNGGDNLGGLTIIVDVTDIERSAEEVYHKTWVLVFLRLVVTYSHEDLTP